MPKTEKDLLHAVAKKVGGERGKRMLKKLGKKVPPPFDRLLDRALSDEEFAAQLKKAEDEIRQNGRFSDLPLLFTEIEGIGEKPGTWGQLN
jgi:hypothetical protein